MHCVSCLYRSEPLQQRDCDCCIPEEKVRRLTLQNRSGAAEEVSPTADGPVATEAATIQYTKKLTHSDLVKTWLWEQGDEAAYNYERLQALGLTNMMIHPIRKLYPKDRQADELKKYMVFFNTEPHMVGPIIHGVALSMEEARANGQNVSADDINSVRTGLMGPAAGIGDTVQQGIFFPILASVGASFALQGKLPWPSYVHSDFRTCHLHDRLHHVHVRLS